MENNDDNGGGCLLWLVVFVLAFRACEAERRVTDLENGVRRPEVWSKPSSPEGTQTKQNSPKGPGKVE